MKSPFTFARAKCVFWGKTQKKRKRNRPPPTECPPPVNNRRKTGDFAPENAPPDHFPRPAPDRRENVPKMPPTGSKHNENTTMGAPADGMPDRGSSVPARPTQMQNKCNRGQDTKRKENATMNGG